MKICALTSGATIPSARYRVRQYIPYLQEHGIRVTEKIPVWNKFDIPSDPYRKILKVLHADNPKNWNRLKLLDRYRAILASNFHDVTWIQKVLIPYHLTLELKSSKPIVFDLDDAIWLDEGAGFTDKIVAGADVVFAGNNYLADWVSMYNKNVSIIPTAVDTSIYFPKKDQRKDRFVVGWIGTSGNFKYLKNIIVPLKKFFNKRKDAVLKIIADSYPAELVELKEYIDFVLWDPVTHVDEMRAFSIGIMPLENNDWTKGKCSFKMLQYMAIGIPVVVSPYGMNKDVLSLGKIGFGASSADEWMDALDTLYLTNDSLNEFGNNALHIIQNTFSTERIASDIASQFNRLR